MPKGLLWGAPTEALSDAWERAVSYLRDDEQSLVAVLGEPGPTQRLTLLAHQERLVVKVAVWGAGDRVIAEEVAALSLLAARGLQHLAPPFFQASTNGRPAVLTRLIEGRHPQWSDTHAHAWLYSALAGEGAFDSGTRNAAGVGEASAFFHADLTPWNVVCRGDGSFAILDWESSVDGGAMEPIHGVLDFVLRGAVVARARRSRVMRAVRGLRDVLGVEAAVVEAGLETYARYREVVTHLVHTPDRLGTNVLELADFLGTRA